MDDKALEKFMKRMSFIETDKDGLKGEFSMTGKLLGILQVNGLRKSKWSRVFVVDETTMEQYAQNKRRREKPQLVTK